MIRNVSKANVPVNIISLVRVPEIIGTSPKRFPIRIKKEDCKQIRHIALVLSVAYIRTGYVIANKDNEHFQKIGQALRALGFLL